MLRWDRHLESWFAGHRVSWLDPVFRGLTYAGSYGAVWLVLAALAALLSRRAGVFIWVAVAYAAAEGASSLLKLLIPRHRPRVHTLVHEPHSHSFPSGHATTSFACATALGMFAPRLRAPLYVLAALIAFSRSYVGVHYPLDVLAGVALGLLVGAATARCRSSFAPRAGRPARGAR